MKTSNKLIALAIIASAGLLGAQISTAQPIDSMKSLENRAVAASPRAKELFPWLTRSAEPAKAIRPPVTENRAFAASPRVLEQYPELLRAAQPQKSADQLAAPIIGNRAVAASPRAKEEFPWLARGNYTVREEPFQVAPLK